MKSGGWLMFLLEISFDPALIIWLLLVLILMYKQTLKNLDLLHHMIIFLAQIKNLLKLT